MRRTLLPLILVLAGCGAGSRVVLAPSDVSPELAALDEENPFAEGTSLRWVHTGNPRYDEFFRAAAAGQGALDLARQLLAEEGGVRLASHGSPERGRIEALLRVIEALPERAPGLQREGDALLLAVDETFRDEPAKAQGVPPALHEAIGQVRDAAARAPGMALELRSLLGP